MDAAQQEWIDIYQDTVRIAYNDYRNYHQGQVKNLWSSTNKESATFDVPTPEEVEMVAKRQGMAEKDPNKERMRAVFQWYWDRYLPIISSHKRWSPAKRRYNCISFARPNNDPEEMLYVTYSDEAYAVLVWENYVPFWTWKEEVRLQNRDPTDKDKQDPRSKPAFTQPDGGVAEYGGWSKAGRKRYRALLAAIKNSKGDPNAKSGSKGKKQFDYVKALETEALKALQVAKQVNVSGRAAKRNPALNKDDEVDSDHEVDWS